MRALAILFFMVLANLAFCQTTTWKSNAVSGDWSNAANWTNGVPIAGVAVIFDATGTGNCKLDVNAAATTLTISAAYPGDIDLNSNTLTVGPGAGHSFSGGTISGTGTVSITSNSQALFNGTDLGANVTLTVTLSTVAGIFNGDDGTTFGGPVTVTAFHILLNGSTYNNIAAFTKTSVAGAGISIGEGGNTFNGATSITNAMNSFFISANNTPDIFNGPLTLSLAGTNSANTIQLAHSPGTTQFNNNIKVRSNSTVAPFAQISFGANGGSSTLADGFTIAEVDPATNEFLRGDLILNNFTQLGNTPQVLHLQVVGGPSVTFMRFLIANSTFEGNVTFSASNPYISNTSFEGATNVFTKLQGGGTDVMFPAPAAENSWDGGNTFNGTTTFNNNGASTMVFGRVNPDVFTGNVTFFSFQTTSHFMVGQNAISTFTGNISITRNFGTPTFRFGNSATGNGGAEFGGSVLQQLSSQASVPNFTTLRMNNAAGLQLNFRATVSNNLDLTLGVVNSTLTNYLTLQDNATSSNGNNASYVGGPMRKVGDDAFTFPVGDGGAYNPIGISQPAAITSEFSAQYFFANHGLALTADPGIDKVSDCEYWILNRVSGVDVPFVTLHWNSTTFCNPNYITEPLDLRVVRWSGALWNDLGQSASTVMAPTGSVTSSAAPAAFPSTLTFGSVTPLNVLPIELISFSISAVDEGAELTWQTASEHNNDYFTIERLQSDEFRQLAKVQGAGTTNSLSNYTWTDANPLPGLSYYRLKQTDFDGKETYSELIVLHRKIDETPYPNPVKNILYLHSLNFDEGSKVIVRDISGRTLYTGEASETIDFGDFVPGVYHLSVQTKGTVKCYSITKQ